MEIFSNNTTSKRNLSDTNVTPDHSLELLGILINIPPWRAHILTQNFWRPRIRKKILECGGHARF